MPAVGSLIDCPGCGLPSTAHGEISTNLATEVGKVAPEAASDVERLEVALTRAAALRTLARALGPDTTHLEGRAAGFTPTRQGRHATIDPLKGRMRELLDGLREELGL